mmetsp:Transcript_92817/g.268026  ORF Transcript_92817/g.268026 Transcript_92817/m.268026 type:complete len:572 (+) Transcript_92817:1-1716(+)
MVREQPDDGDSDANLSSPVRSAKARHAEKANSKLLLLANERIAVLERQLNETRLGREAIQKHRDRENDALAQLEEKSRECEDLEEELNDLRAAMRHIREEVNIHEDLADNDDNHRQLSQSILDIVVQSLHPKLLSSESSSRRRRRSSTSKSTASSPALAIKRQTGGFVHTSDSDDVPDWADDIMKDLEVIAKGEMPSSLMDSPTVADAEAQLGNQSVFERLNNPKSFTGVQKQKKKGSQPISKKGKAHADGVTEGQRHRKMMSKQIASSLDKLVVPDAPQIPEDEGKSRSVFDRLLSPSNLTGTQKQRFQDKKGKRDTEHGSGEHRRPSEERQAQQERIGGQTADDILHGILDDVPETKNKASKSESSRKREEYIHSDVFERLNKTTTQAYAVKQQVNIAEKMLDDLLDESQGSEMNHPPKAEILPNWVEAYTQQNVFERLVKTTTHAYAVKHQGERNADQLQEKREHSDSSIDASAAGSLAAHQHDTASKEKVEFSSQSNGSFTQNADQMLNDILDASASNNGETSQDPFSPISTRLRSRRKQDSKDVFERLQQTTTEAFDKKKSSQVEQ